MSYVVEQYVVMLYGVDKGVVIPVGPFDTQDEACDHLSYIVRNMPSGAITYGIKVDHVRVIECVKPSEVI